MMAELPAFSIFTQGRHFLRLKVEQRDENGLTFYRAVIEGDAATKPLSEWARNFDVAQAAFDEERARYK